MGLGANVRPQKVSLKTLAHGTFIAVFYSLQESRP
jgi:hypothetical protein